MSSGAALVAGRYNARSWSLDRKALVKSNAPFRISTALALPETGLLTASIAISAARQSPQNSPPEQNPPSRPAFQTNVNTVIVDLRVVDKDEKFVADLTKDDFRVFEDDKEQAVTSFSLVDIPVVSRGLPIGVPIVAADVVTNNHADEGRLDVIVLDDLEEEGEESGVSSGTPIGHRPGHRARLCGNHLSVADRAALVTTSGRLET